MKQILTTLMLLLLSLGIATAQRTVMGTVTGDDGEVLIGATVKVVGSSVGTRTDVAGKYKIEVPAGSNVLIFAYTGYATQEVTLGSSNTVDVVLAAGQILQEAVVTALGISRDEKSLGYAAQTVKSDNIVRSGEANAVQALAGKAAGVQVIGSTGMAGASSYILIRGANSINRNNQPLLIVDGVPIDNSQNRSGGGGAVASVAYSNRGIDINPNEIESVTVLKGAAATALYGSLAGNGAILITTKRGALGKQKVSVDVSQNLQFSTVNQLPELQEKYAQGVGGGYRGPESAFAGSWGPLLDTLRWTNDNLAANQDVNGDGIYDWDKNGKIVGQSVAPNGKPVTPYDRYKFYDQGVSSQTNLGISASNNYGSLRFSLGYLNQTGIVPNNDFERINFGVNADSKLGERVKLSVGAQYINSGGTRIEQGSNVSGVMLGLVRTPATFDNSNGLDDPSDPAAYTFPSGRQRTYRGFGIYDNPYWTANNNPLKDNVNRLIGNASLTWSPTSWLDLTYRPSIDQYTDFRKQYFAIGSATLTAGQVFEDTYRTRIFNADALATIKPYLSDDFSGSVTLSHTMYSNKFGQTYIQGDGLVVPGFYDLSNASSLTGFASNAENRLMRGSAIVDLSYRNMLYLSGSYTLEGNTTLPKDNAVYGYYGINGSFVFSEMLDNTSGVLSFGKIRASYGLVGLGSFAYSTNTIFGATNFSDGWTSGVIFPFNGTAGFTYSDQAGNPDLKPERRSQWEIGADVRFFNNRLGIDVAYYQSNSFDVILGVPVTGSSGFTSSVLNAAELSNKGIELVLTATPVQTKAFTWDFLANFTKNKNNVEALAEGVDQVFLGGFTGASTRAVVGNPYGTIFGFGFYKDANGNRVIGPDGFPILDPSEKAFKSALPDWTLGINNSFSYKGLTLAFLLDIKQGGYIWNGTRSALYFFGTAKDTEIRGQKKVFEGYAAEVDGNGDVVYWDHDSDDKTPVIPKTTGQNTQEVTVDESWLRTGDANGFFGNNTEDFVEDASWVRLRDVSLGWTIPAEWTRKVKIESATITLSGRNLWLDTPYTGVDPETNLYGASNAQGLDYFNMPNTKSYSIGVNLKF